MRVCYFVRVLINGGLALYGIVPDFSSRVGHGIAPDFSRDGLGIFTDFSRVGHFKMYSTHLVTFSANNKRKVMFRNL